jgi:hypothetical protein
MSNASLSVRGTLSFVLHDISGANIGKRYKRQPFVVVEKFRGHRLEQFKFATRAMAEQFIASELKRLRF